MPTHLTGMHAHLGDDLTGADHLRQSILDILTTRRGERVMRPTYGSALHEFVDRPINPEFLVDLYYECVVAIHAWEPRVRVVRIRAAEAHPGRVTIDLTVRTHGQLAELAGFEIPL
ncbi:MAG: GPW/gp25 family protein [Thioalkalivibrionaceae bacterium]